MKTPYFPAFLLLLNANFLAAQSGSLDPTFGTDGIVTTSIGSNQDYPSAAILQPDGKILVTGGTNAGFSGKVALLRYNTDGTLDEDFGNGGIVQSVGVGPSAITLQPDGKIIVAAQSKTGSNYDFLVLRFLPDGSPDSTFGTAGRAVTDLGTDFEGPNAVALQADGKIVAAGTISSVTFFTDIALVRYNPEGTIDTTFGVGGIVVTSIHEEDNAQDVAIQPDGKIVITGWASISASGDFALARYDTHGVLDPTFGSGGVVVTDLANVGYSDLATGLLILPTGKILVAGNANYSNIDGSSDMGLVQYNEDGTFDETFGTDGISTLVAGYSNFIWTLARQPDGKIYIAGQSDVVSDNRWSLFRFLPNGTLDAGFGDNGKVITDMAGTNEYAASVLIQSDSKIVLAGRVGVSTNYDIGLARFVADFNLSATVVQGISCYGAADAIISVDVSGGVPPYEYSIDGVNAQSSNIFTGLAPGTYTITILDSNGDGVSGTISSIVVPDLPAPPAVALDVVDNTITINVSGSGLYQYSVNGGLTFQASNVFSDLTNAAYPVLVLDENGCTIFTESVVIDFVGVENVPGALAFELSPNPGEGLFVLKIESANPSALQLKVNDMFGRLVYESDLVGVGAVEKQLDLRFLGIGTYALRVGDGEKWGVRKLVVAK